ncbi:kinase-like domain-containing protein [Gautieria morchelliformis]|nr:kinase-like domain-containing protein [Gautieria morchelliformis]
MSVPYRRHDPHKVVKVVAWDGRSGEQKEVSYTNRKSVGHGTFGIVYRAKVASPQGEDDIAIKKVWQNELSRELQILRLISHTNVVELKAFYWSHPYKDEESQDKDQLRINLVLEYVPDTVYDACDRYIGLNERPIPIFETKLYMYQVLRALGYIHSMGICHRDIKPDNLLINPATGVLKLSDFGSAKLLVAGEPNVSYICSRHYRAPELIFADTNYTTYIDIWSIACVMAELILGYQLFRGGCWVSQLAAIVSVLGTPSREQIKSWNPKLQDRRFPRIKPRPLSKVFPSETPEEATDLLSKLLKHTPESRLSGYEAMCHSFFDELRVEGQKMPNGQDLPPLFDFTREELSIHPDLMRQLVPSHCELELESRGIRLDTFVPIALERLTCLPPNPQSWCLLQPRTRPICHRYNPPDILPPTSPIMSGGVVKPRTTLHCRQRILSETAGGSLKPRTVGGSLKPRTRLPRRQNLPETSKLTPPPPMCLPTVGCCLNPRTVGGSLKPRTRLPRRQNLPETSKLTPFPPMCLPTAGGGLKPRTRLPRRQNLPEMSRLAPPPPMCLPTVGCCLNPRTVGVL